MKTWQDVLLYKIRIAFKSGDVIEMWFNSFTVNSEGFKWSVSPSPEDIVQANIDYNPDDNNEEEMLYDHDLSLKMPSILSLGANEVVSVVQIEAKNVAYYCEERN